jgi:hypothetical protein
MKKYGGLVQNAEVQLMFIEDIAICVGKDDCMYRMVVTKTDLRSTGLRRN